MSRDNQNKTLYEIWGDAFKIWLQYYSEIKNETNAELIIKLNQEIFTIDENVRQIYKHTDVKSIDYLKLVIKSLDDIQKKFGNDPKILKGLILLKKSLFHAYLKERDSAHKISYQTDEMSLYGMWCSAFEIWLDYVSKVESSQLINTINEELLIIDKYILNMLENTLELNSFKQISYLKLICDSLKKLQSKKEMSNDAVLLKGFVLFRETLFLSYYQNVIDYYVGSHQYNRSQMIEVLSHLYLALSADQDLVNDDAFAKTELADALNENSEFKKSLAKKIVFPALSKKGGEIGNRYEGLTIAQILVFGMPSKKKFISLRTNEFNYVSIKQWQEFGALLEKSEIIDLELINDGLKALSIEQWQEFATALKESNVETLILNANSFFDLSKEQWLKFKAMLANSKVTSLTLVGKEFFNWVDPFAVALEESKVTTLYLLSNDFNKLTSEQWVGFSATLKRCKVTALYLTNNSINLWSVDQLKKFGAALADSKVTILDLTLNKLDQLPDQQWQALCDILEKSNLTTLILANNNLSKLSESKLNLLWTALAKSKVKSLDLCGNDFSSLSVTQWQVSCKFLAQSKVTTLDLRFNGLEKISGQQWQVFCDALAKSNVKSLRINRILFSEDQLQQLDRIIGSNVSRCLIKKPGSLKHFAAYSLWKQPNAKLTNEKGDSEYTFKSECYKGEFVFDGKMVSSLPETMDYKNFGVN